MADRRGKTCCFSGYRIEKMPFHEDDSGARQRWLPHSTLRSVRRLLGLYSVSVRHVHWLRSVGGGNRAARAGRTPRAAAVRRTVRPAGRPVPAGLETPVQPLSACRG